MKIYKCYYDDERCTLKFSDDGGNHLYNWGNLTGPVALGTRYSKVEPLETGDTLQEVVDWCKENGLSFGINSEGVMSIAEVNVVNKFKGTWSEVTDLLNHIRKPKHTPEELEVLELAKKLNVKIELK